MENNIFSLDELFLYGTYPNYAFKFHKILNAYRINKEKGIRLSKDLIKGKVTFSNAIEKFKEKYSNYSEYIDDLNCILSAYDNKEKKESTYVNSYKVRNDRKEDIELLQNIYESGQSIIDYYFYNKVSINFYSFFKNRVKLNDQIAVEIDLRENKTEPILLDLIKKIDSGDIDYVGYYEITKLNPYYLMIIAKENNIYSENVSKFINLLRNSNRINIQTEINGNLVIDSMKVSKETKEQAIEYLKSIEAPIDAVNYNNMVRRLIKSSK